MDFCNFASVTKPAPGLKPPNWRSCPKGGAEPHYTSTLDGQKPHLVTRLFIRKKAIRKWCSNGQNLKKILGKSRGSIPKL